MSRVSFLAFNMAAIVLGGDPSCPYDITNEMGDTGMIQFMVEFVPMMASMGMLEQPTDGTVIDFTSITAEITKAKLDETLSWCSLAANRDQKYNPNWHNFPCMITKAQLPTWDEAKGKCDHADSVKDSYVSIQTYDASCKSWKYGESTQCLSVLNGECGDFASKRLRDAEESKSAMMATMMKPMIGNHSEFLNRQNVAQFAHFFDQVQVIQKSFCMENPLVAVVPASVWAGSADAEDAKRFAREVLASTTLPAYMKGMMLTNCKSSKTMQPKSVSDLMVNANVDLHGLISGFSTQAVDINDGNTTISITTQVDAKDSTRSCASVLGDTSRIDYYRRPEVVEFLKTGTVAAQAAAGKTQSQIIASLKGSPASYFKGQWKDAACCAGDCTVSAGNLFNDNIHRYD